MRRDVVQAELRRHALNEAADAYLEELVTELGEPSPRELACAAAIARRVRRRHRGPDRLDRRAEPNRT